MSSKNSKVDLFDPNQVGVKNGNFIGLPFNEEDASVVLLSVPWDVTVSYRHGTASGPTNILNASYQLDLFDSDVPDAWKKGIFMRPVDPKILESNNQLRELAQSCIDFLEEGGDISKNEEQRLNLEAVNEGCDNLRKWVRKKTSKLLENDKLVGVVGGEHSIPLGFLEALSEVHKNFGILQIDAHMDLREAYEGFTYSHASIFYNALNIKSVKKITQVGIRDFCDAEWNLAKSDGRVDVFLDQDLKSSMYSGKTWEKLCKRIVKTLPDKVYVSFDIDGLQPELCPNTGTPVPGGLDYNMVVYLLNILVQSGRKIIGFDLCEVAGEGNEWDGNVGARILYKLCNLMAKSQNSSWF